MRTVYINGKFTAQPITGVQRVAGCLVAAIDDILVQRGQSAGVRWVLLCPPSGVKPSLRCIEVHVVASYGASLAWWEQVCLPLASRGSPLLCLSGSAPAAKRGQVCMLHDAAVFDSPQAYRPAFVAWYRFLFKRLARTAALIATVSDYSRQRLSHWLQLPAGTIAVVPNGADHLLTCEADDTIFARLRLPGQGGYFLVVGSASANKNQPAVLQAFMALPDDGALRLVVVGDGNEAVFAGGAVEDADGQRVVRAGRVTDRELKALYTSAVALVFPSRTEGFGLPPLEAMGCGCPVIASRRAALPEVCGDAALYADPDSVDDIAAAMCQVLADAPLRERLRENGRRRARTFTWHHAAQTLLSRMAAAGAIDAARP